MATLTAPIAANAPVQFGTQGTGFTPNGATQMQNTTLNTGGNTQSAASPGSFSGYPVVTSKPATDNFNSIQQDYNQNIKPNLQAANQNNQTKNQLPVIAGYNVSANPTGNEGETKATNQATGSSYYITPQNQAPTANDIKGILSSPDTGPTPNPAPADSSSVPLTPAQQATAQTGTNPIQENATFSANEQEASDALTNAATSFQSVLNTLSAGSMPLTAAQQSLVDATNSAFQAMT